MRTVYLLRFRITILQEMMPCQYAPVLIVAVVAFGVHSILFFFGRGDAVILTIPVNIDADGLRRVTETVFIIITAYMGAPYLRHPIPVHSSTSSS